MRKIGIIAVLSLMVTALAAVPALAANPHFVGASGTLNANGSLTVAFKEAGLGTNQNIDYLLSADASATYVCVNKGGSNPSARNKTNVAGPVSATGTFSSDKNGNIAATLTASPPGPGSFSCPKGQSRQLAQVSYTNVLLEDTTNNIPAPIGGTFASGCLLPNVRGACTA
jgi:hypothetical protein